MFLDQAILNLAPTLRIWQGLFVNGSNFSSKSIPDLTRQLKSNDGINEQMKSTQQLNNIDKN